MWAHFSLYISQISQNKATTWTDNMELLSWKVCVETDQLDIIINETIRFVIMYEFVIQISLCDELSFSNQAQDNLYNF